MRSRLGGSGCVGRLSVAACALSLAGCQGRLITEVMLRRRFVTIDFDVLTEAATPGDVVRLNLFEDVCFDAVLKRIDRSGPSPELQAWVGGISGDPNGTVSLSFWPGGPLSGTVASFRAQSRSYLVQSAGGPVHAIYEIDNRRVPPAI